MDKLKNEDFFDSDLFKNTIASAKEAEAAFAGIETAIKAVLTQSAKLANETPLEGYKNIQTAAKAIETYALAQEQLAKVEAERAKLAEQLAKAEAELAKAQEKAKKASDENRKAKEAEAEQAKKTAAEKKKAAEEAKKAEAEAKRIAKETAEAEKQAAKERTAAAKEAEAGAKERVRAAESRAKRATEAEKAAAAEQLKLARQAEAGVKERVRIAEAAEKKLAKERAQAEKEAEKNAKAEKKRRGEAYKDAQRHLAQTDAGIKARLRDQAAIRSRTQALRDEVIVEGSVGTTLETLAAKNRQLAAERAGLNLETEEGIARIKEINAEINANNELIAENSDKLKQAKMNVGNYSESVQDALKSSEAWGGILVRLDAATGGMIGKIAEYAESLRNAGGAADESGKKVSTLNKVIKGSVIGTVIAFAAALGSAFASSREAGIALEVKIKQITGTLVILGTSIFRMFKGWAASLNNVTLKYERAMAILKLNTKEVERLDKEIAENNKTIEEGEKAWDGILEAIKKNNKGIDKMAYAQDYLADKTAKLTAEITKLNGEAAVLQGIAEDGTKTYEQQTKAQDEAIKKTKQRRALEKQLAEEQLDLAVKQAKADIDSSRSLITYTDEEIRSLKILEAKDKQLKLSTETRDALAGAVNRLAEIEAEQNEQAEADARLRREREKALFQQKLDFAVDAFDAVKTANEQIIADDTRTLESRGAVLEKTKILADKAFLEQQALAEKQVGRKLALDELANESDERVIREKLKLKTVDDDVATRILEIIRERKMAVQDLEQAERDLAEKAKERANSVLTAEQALAEFRQGVAVTLAEEQYDAHAEAIAEDEAYNAEKYKLAEESAKKLLALQIKQEEMLRDNKLEALKATAGAEGEIKAERDKIVEESREKIRQLELKSLEQSGKLTKDALKKQTDESAKLVQAGLEAAGTLIAKQFEAQIAQADKAIEATKTRQDQLREAAMAGVESVTENLAFEQKKQAELELEREKTIQRQKQAEMALTALKVYAAKVGANDPNPLGSTITDVAVLQAFVQSLPTAWEGTNEKTVGEAFGKPHMPGRDGYIVRVDKNETILNAENTRAYHAGLRAETPKTEARQEAPIIGAKLDRVVSAIQSMPVYTGRDYDATERAVIDTIESKNKVTRKHYAKKPIFR